MPTRLLYAEDDDSTRELVSAELAQQGFAVDSARDGQEAIDLLQKKTFDLVLLDIRMPRKTGLDVLKYMKSRNLHPRIIMLTAVDQLSIAIEAVKLGANDYVAKPYNLETLLSCIQRVLAR